MITQVKIQPKPQRSVRIENSLWDAAMEKARSTENLVLSEIIRRFLVAYVNGNKKPIKRSSPIVEWPKPQRSIRVEDSLWDAAMEKAREQELILSDVIRWFLIGYIKEKPRKQPRRKVTADA